MPPNSPTPTGPDRPRLAIVGAGRCDESTRLAALETGCEIAKAGAVLLCGGGQGVMAAAAEGAQSEGGLTIGILPGTDTHTSPPNPFIEIPLYTGMGQARNVVLVLSADAVIAVGGEWGTLSEIALAMKHRKPVVLLDSWRLGHPSGNEADLPATADSPLEAVGMALRLIESGGTKTP